MNVYCKGQVLSSHINANRHLRHSAYADVGKHARSNVLNVFFKHKVFKEDTKRATEINLDKAWLDLSTYELIISPNDWSSIVDKLPRSPDYIDVKE